MKEERKPECQEKTPDNKQIKKKKKKKKPHIEAWKFKPQLRLKPTPQDWWGASCQESTCINSYTQHLHKC